MHEFEELMKYIWSSVMDAKDMIFEAVENKRSCPDLAAVYYRVCSNRLSDADMLLKQAEACLEGAKGDDDYDEMEAIWKSDHRRILERISHVKITMEMYR